MPLFTHRLRVADGSNAAGTIYHYVNDPYANRPRQLEKRH